MINHSKPHPEVFLKASEILGLKPSEALVVEDAIAGIESGTRGGFKTIGLLEASEYSKTTYPIKNFEEIIEIVNNLNEDNKPKIVLKHIKKVYSNGVEAVKDFSLDIYDKEFVVFVGPSGCGKSTVLRMIAGLEDITTGELYIDNRIVNNVEPKDRDIAMVFQNYALYPHMTIYENMAFGLKIRHVKNEIIHQKVLWAAEILGLKDYLDRKPKAMSGGQRQRVALGRAIVRDAKVFLMDEPLSNLDAQLRMRARKELVKIHEMYHPTLVYVTHDQIEAMTVGDRIALMYRGKMEMLDTPSHVYNRPASVFCAKFIGSPSMNIVEAEYHNGALVIGKQKVELPGIWQRIAAQCPSGLLYAGVRPEHVMMSRTPQERSIEGVVRYVEDYGNRYGVYIQVEGDKNELIAIREGEIPQPGEKVYIHVETEKLHLFDRGTEKSLGYPEMVIRAQEKLAVPKLEKAIAQ